MATSSRHHSSATPLALAYAALVLYASLFPFTGWRWPPGQSLQALLALPWPPWRDDFDLWSNFAGYLPLGLLASVAVRRSGGGFGATLIVGAVAPALLSYGCEVMQQFVPTRHPSLKDWALNSAGAGAGTMVALGFHRLGLADRWHVLRERWFVRESAGGLALLALWPMGLLVPVPVPLGLGQIGPVLGPLLAEAIDGVPWAAEFQAALAGGPARTVPLGALAEASITGLGLLAPCLIAYTVVRPGWRRVLLALGATALAIGTMTLSTLLNFGPTHAFAWIGRVTPPALAAGLLAAALLAPWPRAVIVGCGLIVLTSLVAAVAQAPADPYFAHTLRAWEQGRFVRFHGVAQWLGWLWPYLALGWLLTQLARTGRRD